MGHSEVERLHPLPRDDQGKLLYDVQLRGPEERRRRLQYFTGATTESFGSSSSSASKPPKAQYSISGDGRSSMGDGGSRHSY